MNESDSNTHRGRKKRIDGNEESIVSDSNSIGHQMIHKDQIIMIMCTFVGCGNKQMEPSSSEPERNEHGKIEITFFTGNSLDLIRIAEDYNAQSDIYEVVCPEESVKGEDWENKRKRLLF